MRYFLSLTVAIASVTAVFAAPYALAAVQSMVISPGDQLATSCSTAAQVTTVDAQHITVQCAALPATTTTNPVTTAPSTGSGSTATSINGVPLCGVKQPNGNVYGPAHDPTKWHPLVLRNTDGTVLCTYGHEHGMDPSLGDGAFGPLPLAQQISYPWATVSATGVPENGPDIKHRVYKWLVAPSLSCSIGQSVDGTSKMITAFREELHADGSLGASIRFHSYWGEYRVTDCANPSDNGFVSVGGHMDYADLVAGPSATRVALPGVDAPAGCALNGDSRHEGLLGAVAQNSVWYGANARGQLNGQPACDDANPDNALGVGVQLNVSTDAWGPVDPSNPTALKFYTDRQNHTETKIISDALTLWIGNGYLWQKAGYMDAGGYISFKGHVNRHGAVVPEVAGQAEGQDYIPLVINHVKPGGYGANGAQQGGGNLQHQPVIYGGDVAGPNGQAGYYVQTPQQP